MHLSRRILYRRGEPVMHGGALIDGDVEGASHSEMPGGINGGGPMNYSRPLRTLSFRNIHR
jgi:hypothetical protein